MMDPMEKIKKDAIRGSGKMRELGLARVEQRRQNEMDRKRGISKIQRVCNAVLGETALVLKEYCQDMSLVLDRNGWLVFKGGYANNKSAVVEAVVSVCVLAPARITGDRSNYVRQFIVSDVTTEKEFAELVGAYLNDLWEEAFSKKGDRNRIKDCRKL